MVNFDKLIQLGLTSPDNSYSLADVFSDVPNPYAFARAQIYNRSYINEEVKNVSLLGSELAYVSRWYKNNFVIPTLAGSVLRDYFEGMFGSFYLFALAFKNYKAGGTYGPYGDGDLHLQQIRPVTAYVDATSAPIETWQTSVQAAGWAASFFTIDLTGTGAGALKTSKNVSVLVMGHADFNASPKLGEIKWFENGQTPLGVRSHTLQARPKDTESIALYEQILAIPSEKKWTADVNFFAAGNTEPVLLGVQAVTETYFQEE